MDSKCMYHVHHCMDRFGVHVRITCVGYFRAVKYPTQYELYLFVISTCVPVLFFLIAAKNTKLFLKKLTFEAVS